MFVRLYEQQEVDGVAYEWSLLAHLAQQGVPVPTRVEGPEPGEVRVAGRPVAVFRQVQGEDLCQGLVNAARCEPVGRALARAHVAGASFLVVREGRFRLADVARLLGVASAANRPELAKPVARLQALHAELEAALSGPLAALPRGVIHGDLFRDNVLWQGDRDCCAARLGERQRWLHRVRPGGHAARLVLRRQARLAARASAMRRGYRSERALTSIWSGPACGGPCGSPACASPQRASSTST